MGINDYFDKMYRDTYTKKIQDITLTQKVAPTLSLVSSTEAKNYLKINYDTDDSLIGDILKSSHAFVESKIHKCLLQQSWEQKQQGGIDKIKLMKCPIIGTPTVTVYETWNSTGEVLDSNDVRLVGNVLIHVNNWFDEYRVGDGYKIEYDCGMYTATTYTTSNDNERTVIKNVILRMSAFLYENRQQFCTNYNEENWSIAYNYNDLPMEIRHMLNPICQPNLGIL